MPPAENNFMNDMLRKAGGSKAAVIDVDVEPAESLRGSREFTVQAPGVQAPDDQFVYEPMPDVPGAWAVYPPGVPCDTGEYRISRASPADVTDFPKMQRALDEEGGESDSVESMPMMEEMDEMMEDEGAGDY